MKDPKLPSTDTDPVSPAVTQNEVQQATRDILASAGLELLPEFSDDAQGGTEGKKAESTPMPLPLPVAPSAMASLATYVSQSAERVKKSLLTPMLARFSSKHEKPPAPAASEPVPQKKLLLGAQEEETTLENVLASIAIRAPAKKAVLLKTLLEKATAMLAPLPKGVRLGGASVIALLLIGGITFMTLRPGPHHSHHALKPHAAIKSVKPALAHRITPIQRDPKVHARDPLVVPEVTVAAASGAAYDRSADAAIIVGVRRKISHLCGLEVSKIYRWKYREGYLFCYSRSDGHDTSAILERGADGVFTLIGGTKGLMTYDEMTDNFLVDGEIARYLLE